MRQIHSLYWYFGDPLKSPPTYSHWATKTDNYGGDIDYWRLDIYKAGAVTYFSSLKKSCFLK